MEGRSGFVKFGGRCGLRLINNLFIWRRRRQFTPHEGRQLELLLERIFTRQVGRPAIGQVQPMLILKIGGFLAHFAVGPDRRLIGC